jgi:hypothetical protein
MRNGAGGGAGAKDAGADGGGGGAADGGGAPIAKSEERFCKEDARRLSGDVTLMTAPAPCCSLTDEGDEGLVRNVRFGAGGGGGTTSPRFGGAGGGGMIRRGGADGVTARSFNDVDASAPATTPWADSRCCIEDGDRSEDAPGGGGGGGGTDGGRSDKACNAEMTAMEARFDGLRTWRTNASVAFTGRLAVSMFRSNPAAWLPSRV